MIDGRNFLDQPVKNDIRPYESTGTIRDQKDDCTTGCLLDYIYFKEDSKLIAIDLSKQQALDADPKRYSKLILQLTRKHNNVRNCTGTVKTF